MRIKRYMGGLIALSMALILSACGADNEPTSENKTGEAQASSMTETSSNIESEPQDESVDDNSMQGMTITVTISSYVDEQLTFEYEGEQYTLPLTRDKFANDVYTSARKKMLSEQIINNRLGEIVKAEMTVSEDMTEIFSCNVVDYNGMIFYDGDLDDDPEDIKRKKEDPFAEEYLYTLTKIEGTKYELSNIKRTLAVDLNDLQIYEKLIYPDNVFDVGFDGYMFEDGQFMITHLMFLTEANEEEGTRAYSNQTNLDYPKFFGAIQSSDGETADVLLTDNVTLITVPTFYCEEELSAGQEVMVILDCSTDLFGSGESKNFDYAVIVTDPKLYNYDNHDFSALAYATSNENTLGKYDYVFIDEVQP